MFPLLYSVFIVLQSIGVCVFVYQRFRPEPRVDLPAKQSVAIRNDTIVQDEDQAKTENNEDGVIKVWE